VCVSVRARVQVCTTVAGGVGVKESGTFEGGVGVGVSEGWVVDPWMWLCAHVCVVYACVRVCVLCVLAGLWIARAV